MNDTGSQVTKVAVPAVIALTGTGFFGTVIVGAIVVLGIAASGVLVAAVVTDFMDKRTPKKTKGAAE